MLSARPLSRLWIMALMIPHKFFLILQGAVLIGVNLLLMAHEYQLFHASSAQTRQSKCQSSIAYCLIAHALAVFLATQLKESIFSLCVSFSVEFDLKNMNRERCKLSRTSFVAILHSSLRPHWPLCLNPWQHEIYQNRWLISIELNLPVDDINTAPISILTVRIDCNSSLFKLL